MSELLQSEKITEIIKFAEKRGFDVCTILDNYNGIEIEDKRVKLYYEDLCMIWKDEIIFSHSFLKAFFGEEKICYICKQLESKNHSQFCSKNNYNENDLISWQYHAQQLIIIPEEKRIDYLYQFIEDI